MRAYSVRMWVVCTCVHIVHTMQDSKLQISQHRLLFTSSMSNGRARASTSTCRRCHQKTGIDERGWHIRPRPSNRSVAIARATAPQAKPRLQTRSCNKSYLWRENPTFNPKKKIQKKEYKIANNPILLVILPQIWRRIRYLRKKEPSCLTTYGVDPNIDQSLSRERIPAPHLHVHLQ